MKRWLILVLALAGRSTPVAAAGSWSVETFLSRLRQKPDGTCCAVSAENGGHIVTLGPRGKEFTALPPKNEFRLEKLYYLSSDSAGGLWMFPRHSQENTAYHDGKQWHIYRADSRHSSHEIAFQAQVAKGEHYRVDTPTDPYYPIFTRDGRILYMVDGRLHYYDGQAWYAPSGDAEVHQYRMEDRPVFQDGRVTIRVNGKCLQMANDAWSKPVAEGARRPWQEIPCAPPILPAPQAITEPGNCPLPASEIIWGFRGDGWTWVGNATQMAGSPGKGWITVAIAGTPMAEVRQVSEVLADPHGRWFFGQGSEPPHRYVVYQAERLTVLPGAAALGTMEHPFIPLRPAWSANRDKDELQWRYRVDDGPWTDLGPCEPIELRDFYPPGRHRLQVEWFGQKELLRCAPATYEFEVAYDIQKLIPALVAQLGASRFSDRQRATQDLIRLGQRVLPYLTDAATDPDPEIRLRARNIVAALQSKQKKTSPDPADP
jgi:hypothetical protein